MLCAFFDFIAMSCLVFLIGVPALLNIFVYPISKKMSEKISQYVYTRCIPSFFAILSLYSGFKIVGENKKNLPSQFLLLSNHQSLFDIPILLNFFYDKDLRFVAKAELGRHIPLVSEMLRSQNHCIVPRSGSPSVSMRIIDEFGKRVLRQKQIPVIFPEGTRSKDGNLKKFYSAGFRRLSDSANLPIAVCALDGGYKIGNLFKILTNLRNNFYRIKILGVFNPPNGKEEQSKFLEKCHSMIQRQLEEWRKL